MKIDRVACAAERDSKADSKSGASEEDMLSPLRQEQNRSAFTCCTLRAQTSCGSCRLRSERAGSGRERSPTEIKLLSTLDDHLDMLSMLLDINSGALYRKLEDSAKMLLWAEIERYCGSAV